MKTITGCKKKVKITGEGDAGRANQLNLFFNRFDIPVPTTSDGPLHTPTMSITSPTPPPQTADHPSSPHPWTVQPPSPPPSPRIRWAESWGGFAQGKQQARTECVQGCSKPVLLNWGSHSSMSSTWACISGGSQCSGRLHVSSRFLR